MDALKLNPSDTIKSYWVLLWLFFTSKNKASTSELNLDIESLFRSG
jgi:hypothetical protein